jgi:hypothetical protein
MNENTTAQPALGETQATIIRGGTDGNLMAGIIGGIIGAIIGAILWGIISVWLDRQIGYMAIGVGVLVGLGIRFLGKGTSIKFGIAGAVLAILGCIAGNVVMLYILFAREFSLSIWFVMSNLSASDIISLLKETFQWIDILFYALALYTG